VDELFRIETDRISLEWGTPRGRIPTLLAGPNPPPGRLTIQPLRHGLHFGANTLRRGVPEGVSHDVTQLVGPHLFEQTDYPVYLRALAGGRVHLAHRDPVLLRDIRTSANADILHGVINFGSQLGRSEFTVAVDGKPELHF
jgi:hypothetical protein